MKSEAILNNILIEISDAMSHELKTPIHKISKITQSILFSEEANFNKEDIHKLNLVIQSCDFINELTNTLIGLIELLFRKETKKEIDLNLLLIDIAKKIDLENKIKINLCSISRVTICANELLIKKALIDLLISISEKNKDSKAVLTVVIEKNFISIKDNYNPLDQHELINFFKFPSINQNENYHLLLRKMNYPFIKAVFELNGINYQIQPIAEIGNKIELDFSNCLLC